MSWREYWNSDTTVYVNDRHRVAHYRSIAGDIMDLIPAVGARVLDYGSGEALFAATVKAACAHLYLSDGAERVRGGLGARAAGVPGITVLSPEETEDIPDGSLDLVVVNSLLQYLDDGERDRVLAQLRRKLKAGGRLVVADVIPPDSGMAGDVSALLGFAAREGFLLAALVGLLRTFFSDYRKLRAELGLQRYSEAAMMDVLTRAGFRPQRMGKNLGHNQGRMAFSAEPA